MEAYNSLFAEFRRQSQVEDNVEYTFYKSSEEIPFTERISSMLVEHRAFKIPEIEGDHKINFLLNRPLKNGTCLPQCGEEGKVKQTVIEQCKDSDYGSQQSETSEDQQNSFYQSEQNQNGDHQPKQYLDLTDSTVRNSLCMSGILFLAYFQHLCLPRYEQFPLKFQTCLLHFLVDQTLINEIQKKYLDDIQTRKIRIFNDQIPKMSQVRRSLPRKSQTEEQNESDSKFHSMLRNIRSDDPNYLFFLIFKHLAKNLGADPSNSINFIAQLASNLNNLLPLIDKFPQPLLKFKNDQIHCSAQTQHYVKYLNVTTANFQVYDQITNHFISYIPIRDEECTTFTSNSLTQYTKAWLQLLKEEIFTSLGIEQEEDNKHHSQIAILGFILQNIDQLSRSLDIMIPQNMTSFKLVLVVYSTLKPCLSCDIFLHKISQSYREIFNQKLKIIGRKVSSFHIHLSYSLSNNQQQRVIQPVDTKISLLKLERQNLISENKYLIDSVNLKNLQDQNSKFSKYFENHFLRGEIQMERRTFFLSTMGLQKIYHLKESPDQLIREGQIKHKEEASF